MAAWYQEGLPADVCEEYLKHDDQPIGSFIIRCNYILARCPFVLSIKTTRSSIEHFPVRCTGGNRGYRIQVSNEALHSRTLIERAVL